MKKSSATYLNLVIEAALSAGNAILDVYDLNDTTVDYKDDSSPLTQADIAAHNIIESALKDTPFPILSEEGEVMKVDDRIEFSEIWIVDPLDGTKEFINRNGEFTVNIALVRNNLPVLGVVFAPVTNELYFAAEGVGSFKCFVDVQQNIKLADIVESGVKLPFNEIDNSIYKVIASRSHLSEATEDFIDELKKQYREVEIISSGSSLKLCKVAEGEADCYPRFAPTMEWDTAAGHAICKFSGATVTDYKTKSELAYNKKDLLNNWFLVERN